MDKKMDYGFFPNILAAKEYFNEHKIIICGIEITSTSKSINEEPFKGDTVFIPGNEGEGKKPIFLVLGMHQNMKAICDEFVYIPHYSDKTASLNVAVATSIVIYRFSSWAGYKSAEICGEKFLDPKQEK